METKKALKELENGYPVRHTSISLPINKYMEIIELSKKYLTSRNKIINAIIYDFLKKFKEGMENKNQ
ncbi:hypothetical protein [Methanocaldococcus sp.]